MISHNLQLTTKLLPMVYLELRRGTDYESLSDIATNVYSFTFVSFVREFINAVIQSQVQF